MNVKRQTIQKLKGNHFRLTGQRRAVLNAIANTNEYFTPAAVHEKLREQRADISLVTVYRCLNILYDLGIICDMRTTGKGRSYGKCLTGRYALIVCNNCGRTMVYNGSGLNKLAQQIDTEIGFSVENKHITLNGLCPECRANEDKTGD